MWNEVEIYLEDDENFISQTNFNIKVRHKTTAVHYYHYSARIICGKQV